MDDTGRNRYSGLFLVAVLCAGCAPPVPIETGDYWLSPAPCLTHGVKKELIPPGADRLGMAAEIIWCADRIEIGADRMVVWVRREISEWAPFELEYGSDQGNKNMFLLDDRGNRYDSLDTGGAAKDGGQLRRRGRLLGSFVFPPPVPGARSFVFHDDDDHIRLEGLKPDARFRLDAARQRELRDLVLASSLVKLTDASGGFSPYSPMVTSFLLNKGEGGWTGELSLSIRDRTRTVPLMPEAAVMTSLLEHLAESPLLDIPYVPTMTHTDDYPNLRIELKAGERSAEIGSGSQGEGHVPWLAQLFGRRFTVPTDGPEKAFEIARTGLGVDQKRLLEELMREFDRPRSGKLPAAHLR